MVISGLSKFGDDTNGPKAHSKFTSLLAKIGWRLLQNPKSLLDRVLFGKYCQNEDILHVQVSSACSHGWRSVLLGRDLLVTNIGWTIGNGESIKLWTDPGMSLESQQLPMGPPNEPQLALTVSDLIDPLTRAWDIRKIRHVLPEYEERILCLNTSLTGAPDKLLWLGTRSGTYSVKSGYFTATTNDDNREELLNGTGFNWKKKVWNLQCAPKVKLFSWKLLRGAIPVGERLVERHIPVDPRCKRCGCSESIIHLLFQCRFDQKMWQLAPLMTDLDVSGTIDLMDTWNSLCSLKCLPPAGVVSGSLFPWIVWNLWKARNRFVFEGFSASPEETLSTAIALARKWSMEVKKEPSMTRSKPHQQPPPIGVSVVRTDAAWSPTSNLTGLGWVTIDSGGSRSLKTTCRHVGSPLIAEGLALRAIVRDCMEKGLLMAVFESDSLQLVRAARSELPSKELYSLLADVTSYVSAFEFVEFCWIPRERNSIADSLAKAALSVVE